MQLPTQLKKNTYGACHFLSCFRGWTCIFAFNGSRVRATWIFDHRIKFEIDGRVAHEFRDCSSWNSVRIWAFVSLIVSQRQNACKKERHGDVRDKYRKIAKMSWLVGFRLELMIYFVSRFDLSDFNSIF